MPKSYSQYKFEDVVALGLKYQKKDFITDIKTVQPSELLTAVLKLYTSMPLTSEKAKSEFLIAPILFDIAKQNDTKISFFSGYSLDVDKNLGLKGFCDFLFTKTPYLPIIKEPIFCVVEAKKDDLDSGIPQCIAEMYAAKLFNERKGTPIDVIYGCVTIGYFWQFLKLENDTVLQDTNIFGLPQLPQILGVLQSIVES